MGGLADPPGGCSGHGYRTQPGRCTTVIELALPLSSTGMRGDFSYDLGWYLARIRSSLHAQLVDPRSFRCLFGLHTGDQFQ